MRATAVGAVVTAFALAGTGTAVADPGPATVTVRADQVITTVQRDSIGANTPIWNGHLLDPATPGLIRRAGLGELEFNGGGVSDLYHWRTGTLSPDPERDLHDTDYSELPAQFGFDQFEHIAHETGASTLVHVNYGTGSPQEAAAWVRYANRIRHDGVRDWAIGEEVYLNGALGINVEPDAHQDKSATAYGRNVVAYAKAMKAVDPSVRIGVELAPPAPGTPFQTWDQQVLAAAGDSVDFVDLHWYPFGAQGFFDAVRELPTVLAETRAMVGPRVRIVVGETNSAVARGDQQTSVDNALYLADDELTALENGASSVDWWALYNGSTDDDYYSDLGLISSGGQLASGAGPSPTDVPFTPYYGQELTTALASPGSRLVTVDGAAGPVVTYAARQRDGSLVVLLLNEDLAAAHEIDLAVAGYHARPGALQLSVGGHGITRSAAAATGARTLPPDSITELVLRPAR
ncbi:MAG TPA: hypothetical protein VHF06_24930 [Pseudonocardiaceae bacterium]|nr:hypothetical protein [Pseudonocardiaceae bacterium]